MHVFSEFREIPRSKGVSSILTDEIQTKTLRPNASADALNAIFRGFIAKSFKMKGKTTNITEIIIHITLTGNHFSSP